MTQISLNKNPNNMTILWIILIVIALLFLLNSCSKAKLNCNDKVYTIKKGNHNVSGRLPALIDINNGIKGTFSVNTYSTQHDQINKIIGFSIGSKHHDNSVRIGWMYEDNKIDLYEYIYHDKTRYYKFIKTIEVGELVTYNIYLQNKKLCMYIDGDLIDNNYCFEGNYGYLLYPYYGGRFSADEDIDINLKICV